MNSKLSLSKERIGEIFKLKSGATAKIIEYRRTSDVDVVIVETGEIIKTRYSHLKEGVLKTKYFPIIYNLGFPGDEANNKNYSLSKSYKVWKSMFQRCYDKELEIKYPDYTRATICKEWHNYSNFKRWYDENYYEIDDETMCLDKDILVKGNKIYSPNTCIFASERINYLFVNSIKSKRNGLIGVCYRQERCKYCVNYKKVKINNTLIYTINKKHFDDEYQAFLYYKQERELSIKAVADYYKNKIPRKLYDAMYRWKIETTD